MKARLAKKILKSATRLELRPGDTLLLKGLTNQELEQAHRLFRERRPPIQVVGVPDQMRAVVVRGGGDVG